VPQAAIAQKQLYRRPRQQIGMDPLDFRILNALDTTRQPSPVKCWAKAWHSGLLRSAPTALAGRREEAARFNEKAPSRRVAVLASPACGTAVAHFAAKSVDVRID